jgi:KaiC/GvpD/RAD55 family RecA-like ATPase
MNHDRTTLSSLLGGKVNAVEWVTTLCRNLWVFEINRILKRKSGDLSGVLSVVPVDLSEHLGLRPGLLRPAIFREYGMQAVNAGNDRPASLESESPADSFRAALLATTSTFEISLEKALIEVCLQRLRDRGAIRCDTEKTADSVKVNDLNWPVDADVSNLSDNAKLLADLLACEVSEAEIYFYAARSIREHYGIMLNYRTAGLFQDFAERINKFIDKHTAESALKSRVPYFSNFFQPNELARLFQVEIDGNRRSKTLAPLLAFFETCGLASYTKVTDHRVVLAPRFIDAEYLLSLLFGFPVSMPGINDLLGGGGPAFACMSKADSSMQQNESGMPGRVSLIKGPFGSGKTLFALSLAAEVAIKGGVAWYVALEFSADVALYSLSRLGYDTSGTSFQILRSFDEVSDFFSRSRRPGDKDFGKGALIAVSDSPDLSPPQRSVSLFELFETLIPQLTPDRSAPLIFVVDPLNALERCTNSEERISAKIDSDDVVNANNLCDNRIPLDTTHFRRNTLSSFRRITKTGANLLLLAEADDQSWLGFGEDIADLVIRLDVKNNQDYPLRMVSVSKSRFHREHRGWHPFRIRPGRGIKVSLSTVARSAIEASKRLPSIKSGAFGFCDLDVRLNPERAARIVKYDESNLGSQPDSGSSILVRGPLGTFKTQLGLLFLSWRSDADLNRLAFPTSSKSADRKVPCGLVVSMRYSAEDIRRKRLDRSVSLTVNKMIESVIWGHRADHRLREVLESRSRKEVMSLRETLLNKEIRTCKLQSGYVFPGEIIAKIDNEFRQAHLDGRRIDRVLLDNPGEWEDACPLLEADRLFPFTLSDFFRKRRAKVLWTNRNISENRSRMIRALMESVDTWIELRQPDTGLERQMLLRIARSPRMSHDSVSFELRNDPNKGLVLRRYRAGRPRVNKTITSDEFQAILVDDQLDGDGQGI